MPDQNTRPTGDRIDILLVEDNPGDARLTEEAFKSTATETALHIVTTGDDAVEFLRQRGEFEEAPFPAIVLLDLNLPGGDGCEVLDTLRDDPQLQRLPVMMLTSSEAEEDIVRCYEARANAYLTKPDTIEEFNTIADTIEQFWFKQVKHPPISA